MTQAQPARHARAQGTAGGVMTTAQPGTTVQKHKTTQLHRWYTGTSIERRHKTFVALIRLPTPQPGGTSVTYV
jgi:hypothetical protein